MASDAWEEASAEMIRRLLAAGVQQGQAWQPLKLFCAGRGLQADQVLSIDAHNTGLDTPAVLLAVTCLMSYSSTT